MDASPTPPGISMVRVQKCRTRSRAVEGPGWSRARIIAEVRFGEGWRITSSFGWWVVGGRDGKAEFGSLFFFRGLASSDQDLVCPLVSYFGGATPLLPLSHVRRFWIRMRYKANPALLGHTSCLCFLCFLCLTSPRWIPLASSTLVIRHLSTLRALKGFGSREKGELKQGEHTS